MPALKDKAISLLGSAVTTSTLAGTGTIFTTPPGKITRVTQITIMNPGASLVTVTAINFGAYFNSGANFNLSAVTGGITDYMVLNPTLKATEIPASTAFQMVVVSGAATTMDVNVWGFTATT